MRPSAVGAALAGLATIGGWVLYAVTTPGLAEKDQLPARQANLANGETMFYIGGCASCHAKPNQDDMKLLGGGLALKTSFGTFRVPNISPDPKNGIGAWPEQAFVNAMQRGVGRNGEHLYPAFPYTSYQRMRLEDVRDLYAFLKTLPAELTPSMPHELSFLFSVRSGIALWKLRYLDGKTFAPDPSKSEMFNRGAYLVEGPGHCAECHSPRDVAGGIIQGRRFAGGPDPEGKGWVPNITPHADGLATWSEKDIAYLFATGFTPDSDSVGSTMADVVLNTAKLSDNDRAAMSAYLKALPPRPGKAPPKKS
jgi:mono/diheme cytochrome c family protein